LVGVSHFLSLSRILGETWHQERVSQGVNNAYHILLQICVAIVWAGRPVRTYPFLFSKRSLAIDWSAYCSEIVLQYVKESIYFMVKRLIVGKIVFDNNASALAGKFCY